MHIIHNCSGVFAHIENNNVFDLHFFCLVILLEQFSQCKINFRYGKSSNRAPITQTSGAWAWPYQVYVHIAVISVFVMANVHLFALLEEEKRKLDLCVKFKVRESGTSVSVSVSLAMQLTRDDLDQTGKRGSR